MKSANNDTVSNVFKVSDPKNELSSSITKKWTELINYLESLDNRNADEYPEFMSGGDSD